MYKASILIPVIKRYDLIKLNLSSLSRQEKIRDICEIIILDESYKVEDYELKEIINLYSDKLNIKYVHSGITKKEDAWRIPGFAYNIGSKISNNEILILCCNDIYHMNDTIKNLIEPFKENNKLMTVSKQENARDDTKGDFLSNVLSCEETDLEEIYSKQLIMDNFYLPWLMGVWREEYIKIGGYDEDFIGQDWDDNDFIDRMKANGNVIVETSSKMIHMFHVRLKHNIDEERMRKYRYNYKLYIDRKGTIKRNVGLNWGSLKKEKY